MTAQSRFQYPYPPIVPRCSVCGQKKWSKHLEMCPGPPQRVAEPPVPEPECDCGPGMFHDPFCYLVTGKERT